MRERHARLRSTVERLSEGTRFLERPGDMVLVQRGVERLLVFKCPDGCGDTVPVNLDPRAGPSWRLYRKRGLSSLYPSVWRTEGCRAHFILWNERIYWTGTDWFEDVVDDALLASVHDALSAKKFRQFAEIAAELNEIPWETLIACERLVRTGLAEEGRGEGRGSFRRRGGPAPSTARRPVRT